jgi:hypothetical protein
MIDIADVSVLPDALPDNPRDHCSDARFGARQIRSVTTITTQTPLFLNP